MADELPTNKEIKELEPQKLAAIVKHTKELVGLASMDQKLVFLNDAGCAMLGIEPGEFNSYTIFDIMPDHLKDSFQTIMSEFMKHGGWQGEFQYQNVKTRKIIDIICTAFIIEDPDHGQPGYLVNIALDITDRKREEKSRRLNLERTQALLRINQMENATRQEIVEFALEKSGELTQSELGYCAFVGEDESVIAMYSWSKSAMMEYAVANMAPPYPVAATNLWREVIRQRKPVIMNDAFQSDPPRKDFLKGNFTISRQMNAPVFVGDRVVLIAGVANKNEEYDETDVQQLTLLMQGMWRLIEQKRSQEEKEKLQAQLNQAQKMESIGRLAGGVAHDFNNMLSAILGFAELSVAKLKPGDPVYENLEEIVKAALRSADLTRHLLAFARKQTIAPRVLDLNEAVETTLKMLRRLIGEDITLTWQPGKNMTMIKVDPSQIDQILANLCVNSRDAIKNTGMITIQTDFVLLDETYCAAHAETISGEYVSLVVSDSGSGMDRETLSHLFEPFFTTKGKGKGTGLGLSTVYGIVKQNNGFINVYSEPEVGTTFTIYFPAYKAEADAPVRKETPPSDFAPGDRTILLVEDEPTLLEMTQTLLEQLNYKVLAAASPGAALQIAEKQPGRIHLLVTDVIMPGMNGKELFGRISALSSDIQCLYMSGYADEIIVHHGILEEGVHFIQKPFLKQELAKKVLEALGHQGA